jgi:hypothetical protein
MPVLERKQVSRPRVIVDLLFARCEFAGIVSYKVLGRLAPADG